MTEEKTELTDATLFQLVNGFVAAVLEGEGEWNLDLSKLDAAIDRKVSNYLRAVHFLRAKRAAIVAEANFYKALYENLRDKAAVLDKQDDRMELAVLGAMKETHKTVIETPIGTLRIKRAPHVELDEKFSTEELVAMLPLDYVRQAEPQVNKKALLDDFRSLVKTFIDTGMPSDEAIEEARTKMPKCVEIVYSESVGGF